MSEDFSRHLEMIKRPDGTSGDTVKLPTVERMTERLLEAGGDDPTLRAAFYAPILAKAERVMTPYGIVTTLATALGDYADAHPTEQVAELWNRADKFIDVLTSGEKDEERIAAFRERAKRIWREVYGEGKEETE